MTLYIIAFTVPLVVGFFLVLLVFYKKRELQRKGQAPVLQPNMPSAGSGPITLKGFTLDVPPETLEGNLTIDALSVYIRQIEGVVGDIVDQQWGNGDLTIHCTLSPANPAVFEIELRGKNTDTTELSAALERIDSIHGKKAPVIFRAFFTIRF